MATALVSEPPRPSVEMRLRSGSMPWKPVITATSPCSRRSRILSPGMSLMRADAVRVVGDDGDLPALPGARLMPIDCSTMASSPAVTCSPVATTASYSRASCRGAASRTQATSWLVHAGHGRDDHGHLVAGVDLALDVAGDVANALDVGHRRAAEFHDHEDMTTRS